LTEIARKRLDHKIHFVPNSFLGLVLANLASAVLYALLASIVPYLSPHHMAPVWPPAGLTAAAALMSGWRLFPGIFLGSLFANIEIVQFSLSTALVISAGNTLAPLVAFFLFRRYSGTANPFHSINGVLWFIFLMGFLNGTLSAIFGGAANILFEGKKLSTLLYPSIGWAVADTASTIMLSPALYLWASKFPEPDPPGRFREIIPALFVIIAGTLGVFLFPSNAEAIRFGIVGLLFIPFAWATTSHSSRDNATLLVPVFLISIIATANGYGPFTMMGLSHSLSGLEILEIGMGTSILLAGALNSQRRLSEKRLGEINQTLEELVLQRTRDLNEKVRLLQLFFDAMPNPVLLLDGKGTTLRTNRSFDDVWKGEKGESLTGKSATGIFGNGFLPKIVLEESPERGAITTSEERLPTPGGDRPFLVNRTALRSPESPETPGEILLSLQDIGHQKHLEDRLRARERNLRSILDSIPVPALIANLSGTRILYLNREGLALFGSIDRPLHDKTALEAHPESIPPFLSDLCLSGPFKDREIQLVSPTGESLFLVSSSVEADYEGVEAYLLSFRDITDRKRREEALETLAHTDSLTGVGNRRHFIEKAEQALRILRTRFGTLALFMIDVDHFKKVNDLFGHQAGDLLLRMISSALSEELARSAPGNSVARIGGEEFAGILLDRTAEESTEIAERLRRSVSSLIFPVDNETICPTISLGISFLSGGTPDIPSLSELLRQSDIALYRAKEQGRNRVVLFQDPRN
jgi:diguanylate cyclase (GGDEF)-like protein/PAS domain S-box-containing protein